ncbi:MAG: GTP-binding protein [Methanomassiliicoccales archaeon]
MVGDEERKNPTRFVIIGGYLGSGKTALATAVARILWDGHGKSTAIVTNDQGNVLVDTQYVKDAGFDVAEVLGGCFCSKFPELVKNARTLVSMGRPDVIIAEPIGTSTNILSSVVAPLRAMYPDEFQVAPLLVVLDGVRAKDLLARPSGFGFGSEARIIPLNQVHDAEVVLISKCDLLTPSAISEVEVKVREEVPEAEIIPYSARSGLNLDRIVALILSDRMSQKNPKPDDPALFSMEKASMGWLNLSGALVAERLDLSAFITCILRKVAEAFPARLTGHVKIFVASPKVAVKMSLVEGEVQVEGLKGGRYLEGEGKLVINARVSASPESLRKAFKEAVDEACEKHSVRLMQIDEACFKPRPDAPDFMFGEKRR